MKKSNIDITAKFLLIIFSILFVSSCRGETERNKTPTVANDVPLSEFIKGRWKYEGKYYYEGYGYSDISWEYTFVDENVIKIRRGDDRGMCTYKFIEPEIISIDCGPRMTEIMKWSLKRDGQFLLIQRLKTDELKGGEQLKFERVTER
ncbi:MAG TPA: hypothetical protein VK206_04690 [Anaerolineales bacterium]|nr:hypothetical protein [Anaerolineales bacterium]